MSQDWHVNIVTVCSAGRDSYSLCVSLHKTEYVFIWQCSSVHMSDLGKNLLAHLICFVSFPLAVGVLEDHSCHHSMQ